MPAPGDITGTGARQGGNHSSLHPVILLATLEAESARLPDPGMGRTATKQARRARVMALKRKGWKQCAIAAQLNISDSLVSQIVRAGGHNGERC